MSSLLCYSWMNTILLVEDDEDDLELLKRACKRSGIPHNLQVATDGKTIIKYLAGDGIYGNRVSHPIPDLVFLDLKLPGVDGHGVLKWIRDQPSYRSLPVVMITSSTEDSDIRKAYELGVTSYLRKVASPTVFGQAVRVIMKYWLVMNVPYVDDGKQPARP